MEKDINHIVPVDPDEAQVLIDLVEMLFDEWCVAQNRRKTKLDQLQGIANAKKSLIAEQRNPALPAPEVE